MKQSTLGSCIRTLRLRNHLTQAQLAQKLGVTDKAVSKWERAEASPDTDNLILLAKLSRRNVRATGQPKKVDVIRLDGKAVDENMLSQIAQFAFMYIVLILAGGFIMSLFSGYDLTTNLSAALTCVSNVGPGLGAVGPVYNYAGYTVHAKLTASFLMLFGRLELLPLFILFTRSAWHKY